MVPFIAQSPSPDLVHPSIRPASCLSCGARAVVRHHRFLDGSCVDIMRLPPLRAARSNVLWGRGFGVLVELDDVIVRPTVEDKWHRGLVPIESI